MKLILSTFIHSLFFVHLIFSAFLLGGVSAQGQAQAAKPRIGIILNEGALVYKDADFDSKVIAEVAKGERFQVSFSKYKEAFYKIKLDDQHVGFIADSDLKIEGDSGPAVIASGKSKKDKVKAKKSISKPEPKKRQQPFDLARFVGPSFNWISFRENTMGLRPTEKVLFYGFKMFGSNLVIDGPFPTEVNFMVAPQAPKYYQQGTGQSAGGFVFLTNFLIQNVGLVSPNVVRYFGFGPEFKYSKFDVQLADSATGRNNVYTLEDMSLGAIFNAGVAVRMGSSFAVRAEYQFHWEKLQYTGIGLTFQWEL